METETVTDIDGNVYNTVKIGDQWWMAENLKVTHYRNGEPIPEVYTAWKWYKWISDAFCYYNNVRKYQKKYGLLYNWYAVNGKQNIAPYGWHVPADEEWKQLEIFLGMDQAEENEIGGRGEKEYGKLKAKLLEKELKNPKNEWKNPFLGNYNESGFSARPAGYRVSTNANFYGMGTDAYFWTATEYNVYNAWYRSLNWGSYDIYRDYDHKRNGFSLRCVKD